jgi:hypothetical protein
MAQLSCNVPAPGWLRGSRFADSLGRFPIASDLETP